MTEPTEQQKRDAAAQRQPWPSYERAEWEDSDAWRPTSDIVDDVDTTSSSYAAVQAGFPEGEWPARPPWADADGVIDEDGTRRELTEAERTWTPVEAQAFYEAIDDTEGLDL